MRSGGIYIFLLLALLTYSCQEAYFEAEKNLEEGVWTYNDPFTAEFSAKDTQKLYNFLLEIDHTTAYPYQNIYFQVETIFPDGDTVQDPFSVNLADKFGYWNGQCWGDKCSLVVPIQQSVKFRQLGQHTLNFYQYSRQDSLTGIKELTFLIQENTDKRQ